MKNFLVLQKSENSALLLIQSNSPEVIDYVNSGYLEQFAGTKNECLDWMDDWFSENDILEDARIYTTHKK